MKQDIEKEFLASYDANADALFRHCYFRVYDDELAKDLVQETFCRTWTYIAKGKEVQNIRAFLYRVLRNVIVDHQRKKSSVSLDKITEKGFYPDQVKKSPDEIERKAIANEVIQKLELLDEPYRELMQMKFIDDLTSKEMAVILGLSENTVSVRIHRGIKKMRAILNGDK